MSELIANPTENININALINDLQSREQEIRNKDLELLRKDEELKNKDLELQNKDKMLQEKDSIIGQLSDKLRLLEKSLNNQTTPASVADNS